MELKQLKNQHSDLFLFSFRSTNVFIFFLEENEGHPYQRIPLKETIDVWTVTFKIFVYFSFCKSKGFSAYYCHSCEKDLWQHCKAVHVIDLETKLHELTIYREKFKYLTKREECVFHRDRKYNKYCDACEDPMCHSYSDHKPSVSPLFL